MSLHCECSFYPEGNACRFRLRCVGPSVGLHACSFPCARSNFFHFTPSTLLVLIRGPTPTHKVYRSRHQLRWFTESRAFDYPLHITITPKMPPKHDKSQPRSKQNRSNTPVHVNAGLAAKQRGENAAGSWKFAKNMTIKDPSRTMQTVGRATNTYITYDNKFEFRFWGSLENVCCSSSICHKTLLTFQQVERAKIDLETNIKQDNPTFQHQKTAVGPSRDAQFEAMVSIRQLDMPALLIKCRDLSCGPLRSTQRRTRANTKSKVWILSVRRTVVSSTMMGRYHLSS